MKEAIGVALLVMTANSNRVSLDDLARKTGLNRPMLERKLSHLADRQLLRSAGAFVEMGGVERVMLAEELVRGGLEPKRASRHLGWQEFEQFVLSLLRKNAFRTVRHVVFRTSSGRREIDLLASNDLFLFAIDCKHWKRGLTWSQMKDVARAQIQRARALAVHPEVLGKCGVQGLGGRCIHPLVLTLGEAREQFAEGIPFVPISKLPSFLGGVSPSDERLLRIPVSADGQPSLLKFR